MLRPSAIDGSRKACGFLLPFGEIRLRYSGENFALELIVECKVDVEWARPFCDGGAVVLVSRIVIAVVVEENDFAADFVSQPAGGLHFGDKETLGENPARLLAETDDG